MTIECYYVECEFHSANDPKEEGPFCYQKDCQATTEQIIKFQEIRAKYVANTQLAQR